jgi:RNA polymerase sigma-70 factor (ECF subfamily)
MEEKDYPEFERETFPFMDLLYNFALGITAYSGKAEMLLKETYEKAFYFFDKIDRGPDPKMWICRIMWNSYNNSGEERRKKLKKNENKRIRSEEKQNFYQGIKSKRNSDLESLKKIFEGLPYNSIREKLILLDYDYRIVLILRDILSFSYGEISELLDIPEGVTVSRIYSARIALFNYLNDQKFHN